MPIHQSVEILLANVELIGDLALPPGARGLVIFAHGSGSGRLSPRNRLVAQALLESGLATLLVDLLSPEEEVADSRTGHLRFNIELLADRLGGITQWVRNQPALDDKQIGYFGASTGGAAALLAASRHRACIRAVVVRGGRPDLAAQALPMVHAPTLLIVGEFDKQVLELNKIALDHLRCEKKLVTIPEATHLFPEPEALQEVARLAAEWFGEYLASPSSEP